MHRYLRDGSIDDRYPDVDLTTVFISRSGLLLSVALDGSKQKVRLAVCSREPNKHLVCVMGAVL